MRIFTLCALLLNLFLTLTAQARNTEWSLGADVQFESVYFPQESGKDLPTNLNKLSLKPNYRWKYLDRWRFMLRGDFAWDPQNKSSEEQTFADASDFALKYSRDLWSLQAGLATFTWSTTDGYSPIDLINTKQYFDPLQSKKLGAPSVAFAWNYEAWTMDLVYIPVQRGSILPGTKSRWLPREVYVPEVPENNLVLLLPEDLNYKYGTRTELNEALKNNYALRLQAHFASIDFAVIGYEGVASFPLIEPLVDGTVVQVSPKTIVRMNPDVTLNLRDYRQRTAGFSLTSSQFGFLFKYAGNYTQPLGDHANLPGWTQENIVGLERSFELGTVNFIGILQHSFIASERANDSNISLVEVFRSAYMAGGRLSWSDVWTARFLALYDSKKFSHFAEVGISRRFNDTWTLDLSSRLLNGPDDSTLGTYRKNNSYTLALSRSF